MYTDKLFTGQREMAGLGIYHYGARFYSPKLGRFLSADSLVPNPFNPQDFNRFAYVRNNPVRYIDPSGHICVQNNGGQDEFATPGNCNGGPDPNYRPLLPGGIPTVSNPSKPKFGNSGGGGNGAAGIFTEAQLNDFGIFCGENVDQVACDVYTNGSSISAISINIDFANATAGNAVADGFCTIIGQGCVQETSTPPYIGSFSYTGNPLYWNRYVTDPSTNVTTTLFVSNWSVTTYKGELVAKEAFPFRDGWLGYGSVFLKPSAVNGAIQWETVGIEYGTFDNSIGFGIPNLITFQTKENVFSNFFISVGRFQIGDTTLGRITIWGYMQP